MITTEEIAVVAHNLLTESETIQDLLKGGYVDYERTDYTKVGIIVIPHTIEGEASVRFGQVNVNIHVPDLIAKKDTKNPVYRTNFPRLIELKKAVVEVLKSYYSNDGWNWIVGLQNPPIKEPGKNEHFVSIALEVIVRENNNYSNNN